MSCRNLHIPFLGPWKDATADSQSRLHTAQLRATAHRHDIIRIEDRGNNGGVEARQDLNPVTRPRPEVLTDRAICAGTFDWIGSLMNNLPRDARMR